MAVKPELLEAVLESEITRLEKEIDDKAENADCHTYNTIIVKLSTKVDQMLIDKLRERYMAVGWADLRLTNMFGEQYVSLVKTYYEEDETEQSSFLEKVKTYIEYIKRKFQKESI